LPNTSWSRPGFFRREIRIADLRSVGKTLEKRLVDEVGKGRGKTGADFPQM